MQILGLLDTQPAARSARGITADWMHAYAEASKLALGLRALLGLGRAGAAHGAHARVGRHAAQPATALAVADDAARRGGRRHRDGPLGGDAAGLLAVFRGGRAADGCGRRRGPGLARKARGGLAHAGDCHRGSRAAEPHLLRAAVPGRSGGQSRRDSAGELRADAARTAGWPGFAAVDACRPAGPGPDDLAAVAGHLA
ncbi:hypothetical protein OSTOST_08277, partial [Ostertagia ostertagi]